MPLFTDVQKEAIRHYTGWSEGWVRLYQRVEAAFARVELNDAAVARVTNALNGDPPGLLAQLADIDAKIMGAISRLKASVVGPIELNAMEIAQLRDIGSKLASRLAQVFGIPKARDVFLGGDDANYASDERGPSIGGGGGRGGNYVGRV